MSCLQSFRFYKEISVYTRKVYSLNDCLNDFTGVMTGFGAIITIFSGVFNYFFCLVEWIE